MILHPVSETSVTCFGMRSPILVADQELVCLECRTASIILEEVITDVFVGINDKVFEIHFVHSHDTAVPPDFADIVDFFLP